MKPIASVPAVFEQGEGQDDLLPAIGRLTRKIDRELAKTAITAAPATIVPLTSPTSPTGQTSPAAPATQESYLFKSEALELRRSTGDEYRWTFLEQRIVITPDGTLLVPHNEGMFNIGNDRSYTKYSLHALTWNGS